MPVKILSLPNEVLLPEVCKVLDEGRDVVMKVRGWSMNPFIDGDRDSVLLRKETAYVPGDVALAQPSPGTYVLHRIVSIESDGRVTLMGDGNLMGQEHCDIAHVYGRAIEVIRPSGKRTSLVSDRSLRRARLWSWLLPARRWLLAFYRHIILKLKNKLK